MSVTNIHNKNDSVHVNEFVYYYRFFIFIVLIAIKITDTQHINYEEKNKSAI